MQLLDKQFTILNQNKFQITIRNDSYDFNKNSQEPFYCIKTANGPISVNIGLGKTAKLKQKDGSDIYFTLSEDFLYALNYSYPVYIAIALILNIIILAAVQLGVVLNSQYQSKFQIKNETMSKEVLINSPE